MDKNTIIVKANEYISREHDEHFKKEVSDLLAKGDEASFKELEDRFYRDLEFGTGGLRGVIGGGYNRMNTFVVKRATQGLANYLVRALRATPLQAAHTGGLSAAIAYDSRHYSPEFALETALVFAANGIKAYLFTSLRPTPVLSYAMRHFDCDTGVVVTASHNPPAYNGYKAYWKGGAQVIPPHDEGIIKEVNAVTEIKEITKEEALAKGLLQMIDKEVDIPYRQMVQSKLFRPELIKKMAGECKIVYTPLHGTGAYQVEPVLEGLGLKVSTVPEQREGNGDFPTVEKPNPEEAPAMKMAVELGKKLHADVVMANDPDADRFGIAVPASDPPTQPPPEGEESLVPVTPRPLAGGVGGGGDFILITGNQLGCLLADYVFLSLKETGKMPAKPAMVNSIVTTGMQGRIAKHYGVRLYECLTGFKWIADVMAQTESSGEAKIVFGTEESYGFLVEDEVRDKDGISAAAMTAEMTLYWRSKGKSLLDRLNELYEICGYWEEMQINKYFPGIEGPGIMEGIMSDYRKNPPATLGGIKVIKVRDLKNGAPPAELSPHGLPPSDVLQFYLEDGTVVNARPSGTEPKIKFYASCCSPVTEGLDAAKKEADRKLKAITQDIKTKIGD